MVKKECNKMRHNLKKVLFVSAAAMMALTACSTNETEATEETEKGNEH